MRRVADGFQDRVRTFRRDHEQDDVAPGGEFQTEKRAPGLQPLAPYASDHGNPCCTGRTTRVDHGIGPVVVDQGDDEFQFRDFRSLCLCCALRLLPIQDAAAAYISTATMGNTLANAISPNPSIKGLRPGTAAARPRPSAATTGTVTVDVVTPPES